MPHLPDAPWRSAPAGGPLDGPGGRRQIALVHRGREFPRFALARVLTSFGARAYIRPSRRAARLGVMARLRSSSLTIRWTGVRMPSEASCFGGSPGNRGEGPLRVPGCLTSESEERETWTAGSLRAALFARGVRPDETSAVLRFRSTYRSWLRAIGIAIGVTDLVKNVVTGRFQVLIQPESLILAQSERWRQA